MTLGNTNVKLNINKMYQLVKNRDVTTPNISYRLIAKYYSSRHRITVEFIKLPKNVKLDITKATKTINM